MQNRLPSSYSIIGAGRVATALAGALRERGQVLRLVASRTLESAERLASRFESADACALEELSEIQDDLVIVSVTDDELAEVAGVLARRMTPSDRRTVLHTSGTWPSHVLGPLGALGTTVGSFHPVQTFSDYDPSASSLALFDELPIAIEGEPKAVEAAYQLAHILGARPFSIDPDAKMLFHVAAVMASNYFVTLSALATEIAGKVIDQEDIARTCFRALSAQTVANITREGPLDALTGPIARGDIRVIEAHLSQIASKMPHLMPLYAALATETIRLAAASDRISHEAADDMLAQIEQKIQS